MSWGTKGTQKAKPRGEVHEKEVFLCVHCLLALEGVDVTLPELSESKRDGQSSSSHTGTKLSVWLATSCISQGRDFRCA